MTQGRYKNHFFQVQEVVDQVLEWNESGCEQPMCTARPGWQSITLQQQHYKNRMYNVKIDLPDIIKIDTENKFVRVEPMVTIGKLNDFLIAREWSLPVVPELDDLTIGGLVMGGGIESTSHKYGLFQYICRAFEMVRGDGTKVNNCYFIIAVIAICSVLLTRSLLTGLVLSERTRRVFCKHPIFLRNPRVSHGRRHRHHSLQALHRGYLPQGGHPERGGVQVHRGYK